MQTRFYCIFVAAILFSCSPKDNPQPEQGSSAQASVANVSEVVDVHSRGEMVPHFSWKDSAGNLVEFDGFRGKVTLINFWATWCGPCKREIPDLIALSSELRDREVKIMGISTDRGLTVSQDVSNFVREKGIPYQIVIANDDLESAFGNIRMIPTSFVVNGEGKIVETIVGLRPKESLRRSLLAALD